MFKKNFDDICRRKGISPTTVLKNVGLNKSIYSRWDENTIPKNSTLKLIADYLGIQPRDLLVTEEERTINNETNDIFEALRTDPDKRLLFSAMQGATPQEIRQAAAILETLKKTRNNN